FEVPDTGATGRLIPRDQGYVSVGSQTVSMGIQVIGQDAEGLLARVVSVTTNSSFGVLNDICGLDNLNLKIGMTTDQVVAALDEAIERKRMLDNSFECNQIKIQDDGNQGKLKEIYFPKERLVLYFSSKTFAAMAIYLPLIQVDTTIPGGN
ncbi:MAG: hypothetical protein HRT44_06430, partial [Bdellovibrionales bacterium]|nr:hypothetical protein [Bdellovibrionales bacterium]NQZ18877.1 hypothetical protein [Bdellovibrionales bacterium]